MQLLTKELLTKLPRLYESELEKDPTVWVRFFYPDFRWTWYGIAFDGEDTFFGLVDGVEVELGYFSLKELQESRGQLGLSIERDMYFTPCKLSKLQRKLAR